MPRKPPPLNWIVTFDDPLISLWALHAPTFDARIAKIDKCEPTQHYIWKDTDVITESVKPGCRPVVRVANEWRRLNYPCKEVFKRRKQL